MTSVVRDVFQLQEEFPIRSMVSWIWSINSSFWNSSELKKFLCNVSILFLCLDGTKRLGLSDESLTNIFSNRLISLLLILSTVFLAMIFLKRIQALVSKQKESHRKYSIVGRNSSSMSPSNRRWSFDIYSVWTNSMERSISVLI